MEELLVKSINPAQRTRLLCIKIWKKLFDKPHPGPPLPGEGTYLIIFVDNAAALKNQLSSKSKNSKRQDQPPPERTFRFIEKKEIHK